MPRQPSPHWLTLGSELRKLRSLAGLSTRDLAKRTGLSNARVSRVETGQSLLSLSEVETWANVVEADATSREHLQNLTEQAHTPTVEAFEPSNEDREREFGEIERSARRLITVSPTIISGLLQTPEYAAEVIRIADLTGTRDVAAGVAGRMERQRTLFSGRTHHVFILTEAGLRWPAIAPPAMAAQYDRLIQLSTLRTVDIGILPVGSAVKALPFVNTSIYTDRQDDEPTVVYVEIPHATIRVTEPSHIGQYVEMADRLWKSALSGDEAHGLLVALRDNATAE